MGGGELFWAGVGKGAVFRGQGREEEKGGVVEGKWGEGGRMCRGRLRQGGWEGGGGLVG